MAEAQVVDAVVFPVLAGFRIFNTIAYVVVVALLEGGGRACLVGRSKPWWAPAFPVQWEEVQRKETRVALSRAPA